MSGSGPSRSTAVSGRPASASAPSSSPCRSCRRRWAAASERRLARAIRRRRLRRLDLERLYSPFVEPGSLAFDVGADCGDHAAALLALGARVVAFEPNPGDAPALRRRFAGHAHFKLEPVALGSRSGRARLLLTDAPPLSTISPEWVAAVTASGRFGRREWDRAVEVDRSTLDRAIDGYGIPGFCKVDVEGAEHQVFAGLSAPVPSLCFEAATEMLERTREVVSHLGALGRYEWNYRRGLSQRWELGRWSDPGPLLEALGKRRSGRYGNVYARLAASGAGAVR